LAEKAEEHLIAMERYNDQGQQSLFRIALPELIGQQLLQSKLTALQLKHPDLQLEISTSVVPVDFSRREADLILRLVRPESGRYIIRRLGQLEYGLYGSKDYLASFTEHAETAGTEAFNIRFWHNGCVNSPKMQPLLYLLITCTHNYEQSLKDKELQPCLVLLQRLWV